MSTPDSKASLAPAASSTRFHVGQKVTWMHCTSNGRRLGFHAREGTIVEMFARGADVKGRSGRRQWLSYEELTPCGEKNAVTKLFEEIAHLSAVPSIAPGSATPEVQP